MVKNDVEGVQYKSAVLSVGIYCEDARELILLLVQMVFIMNWETSADVQCFSVCQTNPEIFYMATVSDAGWWNISPTSTAGAIFN